MILSYITQKYQSKGRSYSTSGGSASTQAFIYLFSEYLLMPSHCPRHWDSEVNKFFWSLQSAEIDNIEKSKTRKHQVAINTLMKIKLGNVGATRVSFFD